ncbi:MAG: glycosyltransferase family protein [Anaerolineales bacterium]|jgi:spore coat polysaccharide biosynthesis protein SpsF|nr:glycosyltransferase family protein [Anaerolineales bacterium]
MKTVAIIQARMSSSRLPGKVLLDIDGKPMLQRVIERTQLTRSLDSVVVATTTHPADDPLAAFAASVGIACTRGSLHDVLDRYYQAARAHSADIIVRITADCPLIDPSVIDETVALLGIADYKLGTSPLLTHHAQFDFSCNRLPPPFGRSFPIGLDVEACTLAALERAWQKASETFQREHVMPFLYENTTFKNNPQPAIPNSCFVLYGKSSRKFRIAQLHHRPDYGDLRWTVDTPEDLTFVREIFARLGNKTNFTWYDVLEIVQKEPKLAEINAGVRHKTMKEIDERQPGSQRAE